MTAFHCVATEKIVAESREPGLCSGQPVGLRLAVPCPPGHGGLSTPSALLLPHLPDGASSQWERVGSDLLALSPLVHSCPGRFSYWLWQLSPDGPVSRLVPI